MLFEASKKMPDKDNTSETASVDAEAVNNTKVEKEKDTVIKADEGDDKPNKDEESKPSDTDETDAKTKELPAKSSPLKLSTKESLDKKENKSDAKTTSPAKGLKMKATEEDDSEKGEKKEKRSQKSLKKKSTAKEDSTDDSDQEKSSKGQKRKAPADEESDADSKSKDEEGEEEPKKKSRKRAHSDEKEEEEDEDEEEEELKPGLLEQPVVLEEGLKREKKKVQRLELTPPSVSKDKKLDIPEGSGEKIGDIPRIEFQLNKTLSDDLRPLHRLLFVRNGTAIEVKRNIRRFSGFAFAKNSPEFKKKIDQLNKMTTSGLKSICEVLDLERGGKKEDIVDRLINFLMKPKSSGKALPKSKKKRGSTGSSSKKSKAPKKKTEKRKSNTKKSESENEEEDTDEHDEEEEEKEEEEEQEEEPEEDEDEEEKEESSDEDFNAKKKKKSKKATPAKKTPKKSSKAEENKSKSAAKDEKTKKKTPASKKRPRDSETEDSSDEEPLKKQKTEPTNEELKEVVKKILEGANLEEVTMKTVYKQVFEKYPDFDLSSRKDFIKAAVKQIIR